MSYQIDPNTCINCCLCVGKCPTDAISEQGTSHMIDSRRCINCAACVQICPVEAISLEVNPSS